MDSNYWIGRPNASLAGRRHRSATVELPNGDFWILSGLDEEDRYVSKVKTHTPHATYNT